ncbi:hypothetical protein WA026_008785 [Henosepilachna vigintioctopunctata]|uniref:Uncharacterized protein n=1 Tax=Henosepilachna vigintioctopunctata TaxID=420089 RepID=A0AAW1V4H7_9CUCU
MKDYSSPPAEELTSFSHRIWNLSKLSFDGADRTNFLYRQDIQRHFAISSPETPVSLLRSPSALSMGMKPASDCTTCFDHSNHPSPIYASGDPSVKIT